MANATSHPTMISAVTAPAVIRVFSFKVYSRIECLGWVSNWQSNTFAIFYGIFGLSQGGPSQHGTRAAFEGPGTADIACYSGIARDHRPFTPG